MDMRLTDYQSSMVDLQRKMECHVKPYIEKAGVEKEWEQIQLLYSQKLNATKPEVMVYGIFNAGKSSIINELIGEDRAKVDDVPTTDKVEYYDWHGYRLADTPGVGAPIEHEKVTAEHLKKADVVLFVMATTGSNERKENYERMKDIIDAGKKVIIVLNDKSGDLFNPDREQNIAAIKVKVVENMKQMGIEDVDKKYYIICVNALRAKKGRQKGNEKLLEKSNMEELNTVIMQELKRTSRFAILANTVHEIETLLETIVRKCQNEISTSDTRYINELSGKIHVARQEVRNNMSSYVDRIADRLARELPLLIWPKNAEPNPQADAITAEKTNHALELVQQKLGNEIKNTVAELAVEIDDLQIPDCSVEFNAENLQVSLPKDHRDAKSSTVDADIMGGIKEVLESIIQGGIDCPGPVSQTASTTAGTAATIAAGSLLGRTAANTLGKGMLLPVVTTVPSIPPAIGFMLLKKVLDIIFSDKNKNMKEQIERENEREEQRVAMIQQAREELSQRCRYVAESFADEVKIQIESYLLDVFKSIEMPIKEASGRLNVKDRESQEDMAAMHEIMNDYQKLEGQLRLSSVEQ
ncbi:GTPase [Acidaminococcus fermentans]|uniref:GTPase n=1 Tax=Acidaminococcus fermentans TaxID=905 RepID=UPI00242E08E6|nr:GTPase [Acidaminococcus fermentans]MCI7194114.1 50S ribosome-binding GTPase [Acidaminococcus fermentans]